MREHGRLILPIKSAGDTNCYPLQCKETYVFDDGSRLERDVPYWRPATERLYGPDGTVEVKSLEYLGFLGGVGTMTDVIKGND